MRTRTLVRGRSDVGWPRRAFWRARIGDVRARFAAKGKRVPGINATIRWLLGRARG
jgi:hypothetical protein